jgi:hypothetical protein
VGWRTKESGFIGRDFSLLHIYCKFSYYLRICVCQFACISVTSVITEHASQCLATQRVCGTVSTWVQFISYLFQQKCITFWNMVSNYLQTNIPGLNRILRYTEFFPILCQKASSIILVLYRSEALCPELYVITC